MWAGSVKHYVDVAWIATASEMPEFSFNIDYRELRNTLGDKLDAMREIQPNIYAHLPSVDAVVGELGKPPILDQSEWGRLAFLKGREPSQYAVIGTAGRLRGFYDGRPSIATARPATRRSSSSSSNSSRGSGRAKW